MVRKILAWFFAFMLAAAPCLADSQGSATGGTAGTQSTLAGGIYNSSPPSLTNGQQAGIQLDSNGDLKVVTSGTPSGTQNVNITQVGGSTVATGHGTAAGALRVELPTDGTGVVSTSNFPASVSVNTGATGASSPRVTVAVDSATVAGSATLPAGTNNIGLTTPAPSATVGWTTQSCTVACASTLVSGAHTLGNASFSATVTGWLLVYDATSCSANGTVTPKKAFAYPTANVTIGVSWADIPMVNATGVAACFSTTGPYTATASTTAYISVDYK